MARASHLGAGISAVSASRDSAETPTAEHGNGSVQRDRVRVFVSLQEVARDRLEMNL